jgi:hypothetical protein
MTRNPIFQTTKIMLSAIKQLIKIMFSQQKPQNQINLKTHFNLEKPQRKFHNFFNQEIKSFNFSQDFFEDKPKTISRD